MESSILTILFLPLALSIIMLGMGLTLTIGDFRRVLFTPRLVAGGLGLQFIGLPLLALGIAAVARLDAELAVGLMVVAACPIGTVSNLIVDLSEGDGALSIVLTALTSFISVLTIPLLVNEASSRFFGQSQVISLPMLKTVLQIFFIVILPVVIGMIVKGYWPELSARCLKPIKSVSFVIFGGLVVGVIVKEWNHLANFIVQAGLACVALNLGSLVLSLGVARAIGAGIPSCRTLMIAGNSRNGTLGITIASAPTLLNNPTIAIPSAVYSLSMFVSGAALAAWFMLQNRRRAEA